MLLLQRLAVDAEPLYGPALLAQEVGNALLTGVRRSRWDGAHADAAFRMLASLPVVLVEPEGLLERAWNLSRRHDEHPLYDMVYLAAAELIGDTLYTADSRLLRRLGSASNVVLVA